MFGIPGHAKTWHKQPCLGLHVCGVCVLYEHVVV